MRILEIGCGTAPIEGALHADISRSALHLEVISDAQFLPFKTDSFQILYCSHVLEHLENPSQALTDFSRVAKKCIIRVPNASGNKFDKSIRGVHIFSWNGTTLYNILKRHFKNVEILKNQRLARKGHISKRIFDKMKSYLMVALFEVNELIAICEN